MLIRRDTKTLKQQLADSLGENGKEYWKKLKEFLASKCSKKDLDDIALRLFTDPLQSNHYPFI